jgi:hypothetical protein
MASGFIEADVSGTVTLGRNCFMVGIDLDMQPAIPPDGATNEIYLWIAGTGFNDNTPILKRARLYWHDIF